MKILDPNYQLLFCPTKTQILQLFLLECMFSFNSYLYKTFLLVKSVSCHLLPIIKSVGHMGESWDICCWISNWAFCCCLDRVRKKTPAILEHYYWHFHIVTLNLIRINAVLRIDSKFCTKSFILTFSASRTLRFCQQVE